MQTQDFDGKVALVTGGSSGIGRATALAFAARGARVVVASRREAESAETVSQIRAAGGQALFVATDVTRSAEVQALVARTVAHFGALDCAFNNAGIEGKPFVAAADVDEATWDQVLAVNLTGVFLCMKYQLPHLLARRGAIVPAQRLGPARAQGPRRRQPRPPQPQHGHACALEPLNRYHLRPLVTRHPAARSAPQSTPRVRPPAPLA